MEAIYNLLICSIKVFNCPFVKVGVSICTASCFLFSRDPGLALSGTLTSATLTLVYAFLNVGLFCITKSP